MLYIGVTSCLFLFTQLYWYLTQCSRILGIEARSHATDILVIHTMLEKKGETLLLLNWQPFRFHTSGSLRCSCLSMAFTLCNLLICRTTCLNITLVAGCSGVKSPGRPTGGVLANGTFLYPGAIPRPLWFFFIYARSWSAFVPIILNSGRPSVYSIWFFGGSLDSLIISICFGVRIE